MFLQLYESYVCSVCICIHDCGYCDYNHRIVLFYALSHRFWRFLNVETIASVRQELNTNIHIHIRQ